MMHLKEKACISAAIIFAGSLAADPRFVARTGADTGNCSTLATACLTLNYAIGQSLAGDTINVGPGTYSEGGTILVNKPLTILGNQANVDARTRVGAESVLSNARGISVTASNVIINGFTVQGSIDPLGTKYGIWLNPGVSGSQILNNIIQNNISGLGLANTNPRQAIIQQNFFRNNNQAAQLPNVGTGIYTDQATGGAVTNVLIDSNLFEANLNTGIALQNSASPSKNITIANNEIRHGGRGINFINTQLSTISANYIHNLNAPLDLGPSVAIALWGGNSAITITLNNLITGVNWGIQIANNIASANSNITIHLNNIFGFAVAGLAVKDAPIGPVDFATCNWWGSVLGPTHETLNPRGAGDVGSGSLLATNFNPWLLTFKFLSPGGQCGILPVSLDKSFHPRTIDERETSILTITLRNENAVPANIIEPLIDFLPDNMVLAGEARNTCGGVIDAAEGGSVVSLRGGIIPARGYCLVRVKVSAIAGTYSGTLPDGALRTDLGSNVLAASGHLTVTAEENDNSNDGQEHAPIE